MNNPGEYVLCTSLTSEIKALLKLSFRRIGLAIAHSHNLKLEFHKGIFQLNWQNFYQLMNSRVPKWNLQCQNDEILGRARLDQT